MKAKLFTFLSVIFFLLISALAQDVVDCVPTIEGGHKRVYPEGKKDLQVGKSEDDELCPQYSEPLTVGANALAQGKMTDGPRLIAPPTGGMQVFVPQQVAFLHLNWVPRIEYAYNNRETTPTFPGSASRMVQEALTRLTPQAAWEMFGAVFGPDGNVFVMDNRIKIEPAKYFRISEQGAVLNYPVPPSNLPDVWYVVITVKPLQIEDRFSYGMTWGDFWKGLGATVGGLYLLTNYTPQQGAFYGGVGATAYGLQVLSKNTLRSVTAMSFQVTVQFRNAATGFVRTFTGSTRRLFPIVQQQYIAYWDITSSAKVGWTTWDSEIRTALSVVRDQAMEMFREKGDDTLLANILSKTDRTPEEEDIARLAAEAESARKRAAIERIKRRLQKQ